MQRIFILLVGASLATAFFFPRLHDQEEDTDDVGDLVEVTVNQGTLVGVVKGYANHSYNAFQSIPFAKPPTGERRFKDPEPGDPWEGSLNATKAPPSCPQLVIDGKEDCLFLSVFTPPDSLERNDSLPVMVFFYGGAYFLGGSRMYNAAGPLVQHDVIVVTTNYRLGVLGFFSTEDEVAPGNLGLKDQTLALRWVNENIAAFGGDKDRVTIFGQSAGAASVHYQLLAPSAAGLFSGAIMQSGSAFTPWSRGRDFSRTAKVIGERFNCNTESSEELIACLQTKNYRLIGNMLSEFTEYNHQPFFFAPRVDGDYILEDPVTSVKEGRYSHVPMMIGGNKDEGSMISGEMYWDRLLIDELVNNFTKNGPASLQLYSDEDPINTSMAVYDFYLGGLNFEFEDADNATKLYGDRWFNIPLDWLTTLIGDVDEVYRWELRHHGGVGLLDFMIGLNHTLKENWVCHGDELQYMFYPGVFGFPHTEEDIAVSDMYTKMWTNFAKTRNPTPDDSLGFIWEKTNSDDLRKLVITADVPLQMETDVQAKERAFWESLPLRINELLKS